MLIPSRDEQVGSPPFFVFKILITGLIGHPCLFRVRTTLVTMLTKHPTFPPPLTYCH